ncbi:Uncharacterised protein [Klebsiella pneumoniae]|nr:Uncharacterised protein [Klebsiella pneumoniae]
MGWGDYVRNQVEKILLSEGFSVPVAQGGARHAEDLYNECHRQLKKGRFSMMLSGMAAYGRRSRPARLNAVQLNVRCEKVANRLGCSERVKTVVRQHSQSSGCEKRALSSRSEYVKYR